ncbi:MAG: Fibronectin type III domain protein [Syntrophorhabdaceae bacterium PtaU1.Bin034]|jgi:hypothetical protein|nr:MAG: Fibronectin type III domain protein [Syntrophorhabdaceae bacterium PtaU1.Bin034]
MTRKIPLNAAFARLCLTSLFVVAFGLSLLCISAGHASAGQVSLVWNANREADLVGYRLYYGTSSRSYSANVDVGNRTSFTVSGLQDGTTYYFALIAYNTSGQASAYSNEVSSAAQTSCTYSISPTSQSFAASGGTGSVSVATQTRCAWSAASGVSWVAVNSGQSGTGNGTVTYSVSPNSATTSRSAGITVAGRLLTVTQAAGSGTAGYTVKASAGRGGSISPSGSVTVSAGASKSFAISTRPSYQIAEVKVDGVSVGRVSRYTFSNVNANHTIQASFSRSRRY